MKCQRTVQCLTKYYCRPPCVSQPPSFSSSSLLCLKQQHPNYSSGSQIFLEWLTADITASIYAELLCMIFRLHTFELAIKSTGSCPGKMTSSMLFCAARLETSTCLRGNEWVTQWKTAQVSQMTCPSNFAATA